MLSRLVEDGEHETEDDRVMKGWYIVGCYGLILFIHTIDLIHFTFAIISILLSNE